MKDKVIVKEFGDTAKFDFKVKAFLKRYVWRAVVTCTGLFLAYWLGTHANAYWFTTKDILFNKGEAIQYEILLDKQINELSASTSATYRAGAHSFVK